MTAAEGKSVHWVNVLWCTGVLGQLGAEISFSKHGQVLGKSPIRQQIEGGRNVMTEGGSNEGNGGI